MCNLRVILNKFEFIEAGQFRSPADAKLYAELEWPGREIQLESGDNGEQIDPTSQGAEGEQP